MGFFTALLSIVIFLVVLFLTLLVVVPFNGVVTRYRILYNPKGLNLADEQGGPDNVVGPKVTGVISMFLRVRRIEGWIGLYKGFMPMFIYCTFSTICSMIFIGATTKKPKGSYSIPEGSAINSFIYGVILSILSVPFVILTNRAITTPHRLNTFALRQSLRMLLTSHERRRPWVLWLSPGILVGQLGHLFFISVISRLVRQLFVPALAGGLKDDTDPESVSTIGLSAFILFQALIGTGILCPIEVIISRCSVQRNYAPGSEYEDEDAQALAQANPGSPGVAGEEVEYAGKDEDVLNLRSDSGEEPYRGLRHAYQRILEEEGASALYRAWWLTMIGCVSAGLV